MNIFFTSASTRFAMIGAPTFSWPFSVVPFLSRALGDSLDEIADVAPSDALHLAIAPRGQQVQVYLAFVFSP